jgi:N-acetyl-gamma-glutamylphosphate reductase
MLTQHPDVLEVAVGPSLLTFWQGDWSREIKLGHLETELKGLVEMIDNNPMVCADVFSLPDSLSSLVLVALGPLVDAGLLAETPTVLTNVEGTEEQVDAFLKNIGWSQGVLLQVEPQDLKGAGAATVIAEIHTPEDADDLDALYEERFGRSFYVERDEVGNWDVARVLGTPVARYRLRLAEDRPRSLLTIQVMADLNGKLGAMGVIHAMNVMAGFEESLGLPS